MKKIVLPALLLFLSTGSYAQRLKYTDEGFNTIKKEETYSVETPGQQFTKRMNALYGQSEALAHPKVTRTQYDEFLVNFQNLMGRDISATTRHNLSALAAILTAVNEGIYKNDLYRNDLYHMAMPVYLAVNQEWGNEVTTVAIANAYFNIREYVKIKAIDDAGMKTALGVVDDNPLSSPGTETCTYKVWVDPKLAKDNIEIYFSDPALYSVISKKYPEDVLLSGPVAGWDKNSDESQSVYNILKTYAMQPKHIGYNVYAYEISDKPNANTLEQQLNKNNKWYMWVFRNNKLYYSYMAEPCSPINRAQVK
jgi:hypothetical protein